MHVSNSLVCARGWQLVLCKLWLCRPGSTLVLACIGWAEAVACWSACTCLNSQTCSATMCDLACAHMSQGEPSGSAGPSQCAHHQARGHMAACDTWPFRNSAWQQILQGKLVPQQLVREGCANSTFWAIAETAPGCNCKLRGTCGVWQGAAWA